MIADHTKWGIRGLSTIARLNEAAVAYVIPRTGESPTEAELLDHCRGKIASYKVPRAVRVVADVQRTPGPHGDKAQKAKLRELFLAETNETLS